MFKFVLTSLIASVAMSEVAQVHEHVKDENCLNNYIRGMKPACVKPHYEGHGTCFPHGTDTANNCKSVDKWQWSHHSDTSLNFAPGTLPPPHRRITHNGDDKKKLVWSYAADITQAKAVQIYGPKNQVSVEAMSHTPVNQISFIANVDVERPSGWFKPGYNNTEGCGQMQTLKLPFGYDVNKTDQTEFHTNLGKLKASGVTTTLTMGSWCTSFPVLKEKQWTVQDFQDFVKYFEETKNNVFGGYLDGIDFDWEGFCRSTCLLEQCSCAWDAKICGTKSPDELAAGVGWNTTDWAGMNHRHECWIMPTPTTMNTMAGITHYMKKAGHVVTLVPMSTAAYTGEEDKTPTQHMRNEYVKWAKQTIGSDQVNLLEEVDGVLLQWYSGFDAALCDNTDDPKACTCDNIQLPDYPNVYNNLNWGINNTVAASKGYYFNDRAGNMFPSSFPSRCQACGKNVILPNGTRGELPCAPKEEMLMKVSLATGDNATNKLYELNLQNDKTGYDVYSAAHPDTLVHWWIQDYEENSKCPRAIDCPDWRYEGEEAYSRQLKLLQSLGKAIDLNKVSIGFETLGTDVLVQMAAWADPMVMWSNVSALERENDKVYFKPCTQNLTKGDKSTNEPHYRCSNPLMEQQWGLKFNASEVLGLEAAVKQATGKELAGIGTFTLDGMIWQPQGAVQRLWYPQLCKLNEAYKITCNGQPCCANAEESRLMFI